MKGGLRGAILAATLPSLVTSFLFHAPRYVSRQRPASAAAESSGFDCTYSALYPKQYVAYKTDQLSLSALNGDLAKEVVRVG
jgi:hypothetical protein